MPVFEALADPTRRRLLELLAAGERSAGALAAEFDISRPGVSRHLRILREAGLVRTRGEGQRRLYSVDLAPLGEVDDWLDRWRGFWVQRLDVLDTELHRADTPDRRDDQQAESRSPDRRDVPGSRPPDRRDDRETEHRSPDRRDDRETGH